MPNQRGKGKHHVGAWLSAEELKGFEELSKRIGTWDNIENKPNHTNTIREIIKRLSENVSPCKRGTLPIP